jgi:O-methyltransferase
MSARKDELDPLPYFAEWPSLRSATGRVDIHSLAAFWARESKLVGDYYEFGVASGRSLIAALRASRLYGWSAPARFRLFDSFRGLPELSGPDVVSNQFSAGAFAFDMDAVVKHLSQRGVWDPDRICFYPGWYEESLTSELQTNLAQSPAAIVHIDCDLYESTRTVLRFLTPLLREGSILLFDDWFCFNASPSHGERRAVNEWLVQESGGLRLERYAEYGWHGAAFIATR